MTRLPDDPMILASSINMMLRDGEYEDLDDICAAFDCDRPEIEAKLASVGLSYDASLNKVR
ncbi:MAG: DUF4250 domain-containing protein [Bacteroidales bacterium]|nr:DUF4250 domain-containing protein [Bacteroidales bacterium]